MLPEVLHLVGRDLADQRQGAEHVGSVARNSVVSIYRLIQKPRKRA